MNTTRAEEESPPTPREERRFRTLYVTPELAFDWIRFKLRQDRPTRVVTDQLPEDVELVNYGFDFQYNCFAFTMASAEFDRVAPGAAAPTLSPTTEVIQPAEHIADDLTP